MVATALYANAVGGHAGLGGTAKVLPLVADFTADALTPASVVVVGKLPAHSVVVGGWFTSDDLDTGDETLELDFGWNANGGAQTETYTDPFGNVFENSGYQKVAAGLLDSGVLSGDAVTDVIPASKNYRPVTAITRPKYFARETEMIMTVTAAAATQAAGSATLNLIYFIP